MKRFRLLVALALAAGAAVLAVINQKGPALVVALSGVVAFGSAALDGLTQFWSDRSARRALQHAWDVYVDELRRDATRGGTVIDRRVVEAGHSEPEPWRVVRARSLHLVLLGEPGSGKTTLLRQEAARLARQLMLDPSGPGKAGRTAIPMLTTARELATELRLGREPDPWDALLRVAVARSRPRLPAGGADALRQWMRAQLVDGSGRLVLLVDGLDELGLEGGERGGVYDAIATVALTNAGTVVVASRIAGFAGSPMADAKVIHLAPFDRREIGEFVKTSLQGEDAEEFLRRLDSLPQLADIAPVPRLLSFLCMSGPGGLPETRTQLYGQLVQHELDARWKTEPGIPAERSEERAKMLSTLTAIAWRMAATDDGRPAWAEELAIEELLVAVRDHCDREGTWTVPEGNARSWRELLVLGAFVTTASSAEHAGSARFVQPELKHYLTARHLAAGGADTAVSFLQGCFQAGPPWAEVVALCGGLLPEDGGQRLARAVRTVRAEAPDPFHRLLLLAGAVVAESTDCGEVGRETILDLRALVTSAWDLDFDEALSMLIRIGARGLAPFSTLPIARLAPSRRLRIAAAAARVDADARLALAALVGDKEIDRATRLIALAELVHDESAAVVPDLRCWSADRSDDPAVRLAAARDLARAGSTGDALPVLADLAFDESVDVTIREQAVAEYDQIGGETAVEDMLRLVSSTATDAGVRARAAEALVASRRYDEARPVVAELMDLSYPPAVRVRAAGAWFRLELEEDRDATESLEIVTQAAISEDGDPAAKTAAREVLERLLHVGGLSEMLDSAVRIPTGGDFNLSWFMVPWAPGFDLAKLAQEWADGIGLKEALRGEVLVSNGQHDEAKAVFRRLLRKRSSDPVTRYLVAEALGRLGERREATTVLVDLASQPMTELSAFAAEALGRVGDPDVAGPVLEVMADDADTPPERRLGAARGLEWLRPERAVVAYAQLAATPGDFEIRSTAADALARLGGDQAGDALVVIALDGSEEHSLRKVAATGLAHNGGQAAIGALMRLALAPGDGALRRIAVDALGELGGEEATRALGAIACDPDDEPGLREAAARALASVGGERAAHALMALVNEEQAGSNLGQVAYKALKEVAEDLLAGPDGTVWRSRLAVIGGAGSAS